MSTLLLPIGHPVEASRALERVAQLAGKGDRVVVLHLHESVDAAGTAAAAYPEDEGCLADKVVHTLRQAGIPATTMVRTSAPTELAKTIAAIATAEHADIVLIGGEPTWLSTHDRPLAQLTRLLPGVRIVGVC